VPRWHWQIEHGTLSVPAGTGRVSMVDARDIAAVAAATLLEPGHEGHIYEITGPEALAFSEIAHHLSETIGRPVRYIDVLPETALAELLAAGLPSWWAEYRVGVYRLYREAGPDGWAAKVTDVVAEVGGQPPHSFAEFTKGLSLRLANLSFPS
jgi:NAD(P)H dehydrogenase (quinone)